MGRDVMSSEEFSRQEEKNTYYRDGFHNMLRIANIEAVVILAMSFFLAFLIFTAKDKDRFFAETLEGRRMQMAGLPLPNMGSIAITSWVSGAATQIMTFGFNDIDERFSESRGNFTAQGWESFRKAMMVSGLVDEIIKSQQIITSAPSGPVVLVSEGLVKSKYRWTFDVPLLITFRSGSVKLSRFKTARVVVETIPTRENPTGVGIAEWYIR